MGGFHDFGEVPYGLADDALGQMLDEFWNGDW
jgi:hypothetical protein